ncbi:MAG TPA: mechanosensitive ion channel [Methanothrix sp.]|nr:mechanosensitive ion channel [Methanothrix sp.]HPJ84371.1 mechanosensitive ion channel [Methanothrix sp.]HPR67252.1 mechanosensitive ion channel [Methanothrix sp.]
MAENLTEAYSNLSPSTPSGGASGVSANVSSSISSDIPSLGIDSSIVMNALLVLALAYAATRIVVVLLTWLSEKVYEHRITVKMAIPLAKFAIYGFAMYHVLGSVLQLSTAQLVAFSGLAGAAIGFGLKDLVAELVGGIVIVLDKPYQVGDKVRIDGHYGEVRDIGLRATRLVSPDDSLITVSNQKVLSQILANANAGSREMMVVIDLFIDSASDAARAMEILREATVTSRYVYISEKRPVTVLLKDRPFYRRVRAKAYVYDLRDEFQFESDVTKRAWEAFEAEGIEPPKAGVVDIGAGSAAGGIV